MFFFLSGKEKKNIFRSGSSLFWTVNCKPTSCRDPKERIYGIRKLLDDVALERKEEEKNFCVPLLLYYLLLLFSFFFFCCCRRYTLQSVRLTRGGKKIDADSVRAKRNKKKEDEISFFFLSSLFVCGPKVCSFFLSLLGLLKTNGVRCCVCFLIPLYLLPLVGFFISLCAYARPPKDVRLCVCVLSLSHQQYSDRGPRTPPQGLLSFVNYFIDTQASCLLLFLVSCTFSFVCVCL